MSSPSCDLTSSRYRGPESSGFMCIFILLVKTLLGGKPKPKHYVMLHLFIDSIKICNTVFKKKKNCKNCITIENTIQ